MRSFPRHHVVTEHADAFDLGLNAVAWLMVADGEYNMVGA